MPSTRVEYIDNKIQHGRGRAASVYGQTYNVYRLSPKTSGSIFDGPPVLANYPMSVKLAKKNTIENDTFNIKVFQGTCDITQLQLGDVLVETGFEGETGDIFVFAQRRPMRVNLFVRCEGKVLCTRPQPRGGQSGQQPPSGWIAAPDYIGADKASEWTLTLNNGAYSFVKNGTPAAFPAGLQPLNRVRDGRVPKIPSTIPRDHFTIYCPLPPGTTFQEKDRFAFPNFRYEAQSIYTSEQTGLGGYIIIAEMLAN